MYIVCEHITLVLRDRNSSYFQDTPVQTEKCDSELLACDGRTNWYTQYELHEGQAQRYCSKKKDPSPFDPFKTHRAAEKEKNAVLLILLPTV
jgi:hypothetical protein